MRISPLATCVGVTAVALTIYDGIGVLFLIRDYDVVSSCRASNSDVHALWQTSLWTYVMWSLLGMTSVSVLLLLQHERCAVVPIRRSFETGRKTLNRNRSPRFAGTFNDSGPLRFGHPALPDWLFLWVGCIFICTGLLLTLLAFWGYWELFKARPWCADGKAAFDELDLWYFGRVSFVLQIIASILLYIAGAFYWAAPLFFEVRDQVTVPEGHASANDSI